MNRRNFLRGAMGVALFPVVAYAAAKPTSSALTEGVTPPFQTLDRAPKIIETVNDWPTWQYGDFIAANHRLTEDDIILYKDLCRYQARETFAALQVPDACDKLEYTVFQANPDDGDTLSQCSTVGWKVTIPAPQWQRVLSEHGDKQGYLKSVLRTRKRLISVSLNGNTQMVPRVYVRDYLRLVAR